MIMLQNLYCQFQNYCKGGGGDMTQSSEKSFHPQNILQSKFKWKHRNATKTSIT